MITFEINSWYTISRIEVDRVIKKQNLGFTLIELIAVIVIIAAIAVITFPIFIDVIDNSEIGTVQSSAHGLVKAAEQYHAMEMEPNAVTENKVFEFPNQIEGLDIRGNKPNSGTITVRPDGKVSLTVKYDEYCAKKEFTNDKITVIDVGSGVCN